MTMRSSEAKPFTGYHMIAIMVAFFAVIIAVNLVMAGFAAQSWTGLVVKNSYVASQNFNEKNEARLRQKQMGWQRRIQISDGTVTLRMTDASDGPAPVHSVDLTFRRPAYEGDDHRVSLTRQENGSYTAGHRLADGVWVVEVEAETDRGESWHDSFRMMIANGRLVQ